MAKTSQQIADELAQPLTDFNLSALLNVQIRETYAPQLFTLSEQLKAAGLADGTFAATVEWVLSQINTDEQHAHQADAHATRQKTRHRAMVDVSQQ